MYEETPRDKKSLGVLICMLSNRPSIPANTSANTSSYNWTSGYCRFSDGTLLQHYKLSNTGTQTITWPTPFSNTDYVVVSGDWCDRNCDENLQIRATTSTTCTIYTMNWVYGRLFAFGR